MAEEEIKEIVSESPEDKKKKRKSGLRKYIFYISFVLIATGLSLFLALKDNFNTVVDAFGKCDIGYIFIMIGVVFISFVIEALVINLFMHLYTRKYYLHQGLAVTFIGQFYSAITPGASGGQVMQAYTLKKQGAQISNAASLLVMFFILYQVALIILDIFAVTFKAGLLMTVGGIPVFGITIPIWPLTILGFLLNLSIIGLLFLMSYSHKIHNFIMHYGVGLLAKLRILKHPDKTRENLRIQVENFKIELRRLLSNFRITFLIFLLIFTMLVLKFSIPWFAGIALDGYGEIIKNGVSTGIQTTGNISFNAFWDAVFMSSYHQMVTGLIPVPGGAGISELFFSALFSNFYKDSGTVAAAQILWRSVTFYLVIPIAGLISAFYKASPKKEALEVNRRTFVTMQFETFEERKLSSDTLYETSQINRKDLQNRLRGILTPRKKDKKIKNEFKLDDADLKDEKPFIIEQDFLKSDDKVSKKKYKDDGEWRDFDIK